ncbi:MAG: hypothetical protein WDA60_18480, partial [Acidimicrobiia bacterium]
MIDAAIAGVGYTPFSRASGRSVLSLAREACLGAIDDAGLNVEDVDGIVSFSLLHDSVPCLAVATALALAELRLAIDLDLGGQAPCHMVGLAAAAVQTGRAANVLVYRALNGRSGSRVGAMQFAGSGGPFRYPIGYDAYLMYVAMWARRFLAETGQDASDLAAVVMAQRAYATANPRAARARPLTLEEYLAAPFVVEPFRAADCTIEVDGECAVLVTS